jgi:hypothetical protein
MSGRRSLREPRRSAAALAFAFAISGCAATIPNAPSGLSALQDGSGPISKHGYRLAALPQEETASDLGSFSGGGKRSAACGYQILKGSRDVDQTRERQQAIPTGLDMKLDDVTRPVQADQVYDSTGAVPG